MRKAKLTDHSYGLCSPWSRLSWAVQIISFQKHADGMSKIQDFSAGPALFRVFCHDFRFDSTECLINFSNRSFSITECSNFRINALSWIQTIALIIAAKTWSKFFDLGGVSRNFWGALSTAFRFIEYALRWFFNPWNRLLICRPTLRIYLRKSKGGWDIDKFEFPRL